MPTPDTPDSPANPGNTADSESARLPPAELPEDADKPAPPLGAQGLDSALKRLRLLKNLSIRHVQDSAILDNLYMRSIETVEARLLSFSRMSLPIPQKPRQLIRNVQDLLETLAKLLLNPLAAKDDAPPAAATDNISPLALWRVLHLLSRHLFISSLTASPPGKGIWKQLHQTYGLARQQGITYNVPEKATRSLRDEYYAAILLGCAQPTSFSGRDVFFLDRYLERFCEQVETNIASPEEIPVTFWINPESDAPATPYSRKPPAPGTLVLNFSCRRLASLLESQLNALETGTPPKWINLPSFAATASGLGVLNRLIHRWGKPGVRRLPRRSQNYRGELCLGFDKLRRLYGKAQEAVETSAWMITNESPDGYAVMHLSGKTQAITVGDIAALRTEHGDAWQLCIIRWALSENQEHIELGLQILASRAYAAEIALPTQADADAEAEVDANANADASHRRPTLLLPATPMLRKNEALVVRTGTLAGHSKNLVLVIERDNVEIREISGVQCDERNGLIELYEVTTAWN
ncbi:MAG: hypothetical protein LBS49_08380 [Candidatus Accumulibacter sp.]|jgi:hypothetical protein|nr:hypothetical protein [Accumulibacter sp.]